MDITDIVSTDYLTHRPDERISTLVGTFEDPSIKGVVVRGDEYEGIVTRRQLAASHHQPNQKIGTVTVHVPRLDPDEDVREAARLMVASDVHLLPVFDGPDLVGVVTVDDVLTAVEPHLDAATVGDVYTSDLLTLEPETRIGTALNRFREERISHLPVEEDGRALGVLSLYDVTSLVVRAETQSQGGDPGGTDPFGGQISDSSGRTRAGGFGAREGELERVLELPVRDLMSSPARTIDPSTTLEDALVEMRDVGASSLVVTDDGEPFGIVTKTDFLEALTWETEDTRAIQVFGIDLLDDATNADVRAIIDELDDRDAGMRIHDAKVHLHRHDETLRGRPLVLARIRLYTDRGVIVGSGEGWGATHALNEARHVLERQVRDRKTHGRTKKPPSADFWEKRFGWVLESAETR